MITITGDPELKAELPAELLSEERLAASAIEQKRLAEVVNSPFSNKTPQDIQRFNAGIIIAETEKMLEAIPLADMHEVARNIYAEALVTTGEFAKAAEAAASPEHAEFYKAIVEAIKKDDGERCECQPDKVGEKYVNHQFVEAEIWSVFHNRQMPIIKCNKCGHRNVKSLPQAIAKERELRAKVKAYTAGKPHEEARNITSQLMK